MSNLTLSFDLMSSVVLFGLLGALMLVYAIRALFNKGQSDRVDREDKSGVFNKGLMEMFRWALQPVARLLVFLGVGPKGVSFASLVMAILTGLSLCFGHFGFAALFGTLSAAFNTLDEMVAQMTGVASNSGEVLDAAMNRYSEFFFFGGLLIYYREMPELLVLVLLTFLGAFMVSYSTAKAQAMGKEVPRGSMRRSERAFYLVLGAALSPMSIHWLEAPYAFPISVGYPMVAALSIVAFFGNLSAIERLAALRKVIEEEEDHQKKLAMAREQATAEEVDSNSVKEPIGRV